MNRQRFLSVVPGAARRCALVSGCCVAVAGLAAAGWAAAHGEGIDAALLYSAAALVLGMIVTTWTLAVGFVYEDARRRSMRPILWALVVALVPHLLGFLLFFALRQPLALPCRQCGQKISPNQRFCSWCGASQTSTPSTDVPLAAL